jgi:hypothetical protein
MAEMYTPGDARRYEEEQLVWDQYYRDIAREAKEHREERLQKEERKNTK